MMQYKHIKLFEEFLNEAEFPSQFDIGDCVSFIPMAKQSEELAITRESRFGKIVAVRFTLAKVFYDVLDDYLGIVFANVDSSYVEPSEARKNLEEK